MASRITNIAELDGLSIKDAARMPHPVELVRWSGLYEIDADMGVFRLTDEARAQIAVKAAPKPSEADADASAQAAA